jgi:hypothetical protein
MVCEDCGSDRLRVTDTVRGERTVTREHLCADCGWQGQSTQRITHAYQRPARRGAPRRLVPIEDYRDPHPAGAAS